jgi:hypothetical protein
MRIRIIEFLMKRFGIRMKPLFGLAFTTMYEHGVERGGNTDDALPQWKESVRLKAADQIEVVLEQY